MMGKEITCGSRWLEAEISLVRFLGGMHVAHSSLGANSHEVHQIEP